VVTKRENENSTRKRKEEQKNRKKENKRFENVYGGGNFRLWSFGL
jgi:hypothetical protein